MESRSLKKRLGNKNRDSAFCALIPTHSLQEVTALVRDTVDQRVQQYAESLHNRRQHKQKKELAPASALVVKGNQCFECNFKVYVLFTFNLISFYTLHHFISDCNRGTLYIVIYSYSLGCRFLKYKKHAPENLHIFRHVSTAQAKKYFISMMKFEGASSKLMVDSTKQTHDYGL